MVVAVIFWFQVIFWFKLFLLSDVFCTLSVIKVLNIMYFLTYWYLICMNICIYLLSIFNEPSLLTKGFQFIGSGVDQKPLASKDVNNPN